MEKKEILTFIILNEIKSEEMGFVKIEYGDESVIKEFLTSEFGNVVNMYNVKGKKEYLWIWPLEVEKIIYVKYDAKIVIEHQSKLRTKHEFIYLFEI